jgi:hypothetical protein
MIDWEVAKALAIIYGVVMLSLMLFFGGLMLLAKLIFF